MSRAMAFSVVIFSVAAVYFYAIAQTTEAMVKGNICSGIAVGLVILYGIGYGLMDDDRAARREHELAKLRLEQSSKKEKDNDKVR